MIFEMLQGTGFMMYVVVIACLIVFMAMIVDLVSGLYKAKQRNEMRSSWGLKRTLSKFIMYEGGMVIAAGIDLLIFLSKLFVLFHLDVMQGVPVITCIVGIFLLIVEFLSVREAADEKTKTEMSRVATAAATLVNKDDLVTAITTAIIEATKHKSHEDTD